MKELTKTGEETVNYEEAKRRLLPALSDHDPKYPNACGRVIWPQGRMTSQGFAFAAAKFLARMEQDGLIRYHWTEFHRGWIRNRR